MNMIQKFFEIEIDTNGSILSEENRVNHKLFIGGEVDLSFGESKKLKSLKIANIANAMKRQGQFPVILLNLKDVKGSSYQETLKGVEKQLIKLFSNHRYMKNSAASDRVSK